MPTNSRTIHFIGIGGAGMSAIAKVLLEAGNTITGSDLRVSDATERLSAMGATICVGHREENVQDPDVVVVSSAIPVDNVELLAAKGRGIPVMQRGEMLAGAHEPAKRHCRSRGPRQDHYHFHGFSGTGESGTGSHGTHWR